MASVVVPNKIFLIGAIGGYKKVAGDEFLASRGFVVNPVKISYDFTKSLVEFL